VGASIGKGESGKRGRKKTKASADGMESLAELEQLCNVLYNSHNPNERQHAEGVLRPFSTNVDYIPQCKVRARVTLC
jgi:hypothetical protein